MKSFYGLVLALLYGQSVNAQLLDTVQFTYVSEFLYEAFLPYSCYSAKFDYTERPFLYTANLELGIVSYDLTDIQNPIPIDTVLPIEFGGLKPTNLWHEGALLYASLGGIQGVAQDAGLAIIDVSDPNNLHIVGQWTDDTYDQGAAIVVVEGNYAYLGAMELGVIVLDVSIPSSPQFEGNAPLDPNFPNTPGLFSTPNARGMAVRNDTVYVGNDAGGLRIVNATDKQNPVEIAKYVNESLDSIAQPAYNNVLLVEDYAYVPVDYCGLDVVYISDTAMMNVNWLDPWGCEGANWNGRPGHTNEIERVGDNLVFVSAGDSELLAYDISDRENPVRIGEYIFEFDSVATWGLTANDQYVILALVNNSVFQQPYYSDVGGIMVLEWNAILDVENIEEISLNIFPNPASQIVTIESPEQHIMSIYNVAGGIVHQELVNGKTNIDVSRWSKGVYVVKQRFESKIRTQKLVVN